MEIFSGLSDDQTALLGCFAALVLSGAAMSLSYYIGRSRRERDTLGMPTRQPIDAGRSDIERKAA